MMGFSGSLPTRVPLHFLAQVCAAFLNESSPALQNDKGSAKPTFFAGNGFGGMLISTTKATRSRKSGGNLFAGN